MIASLCISVLKLNNIKICERTHLHNKLKLVYLYFLNVEKKINHTNQTILNY